MTGTISFNNSASSLSAQRRLNETNLRLREALTKLSTGQRINSAKDDAAGLALASSLNVHSRVYNQGLRNINDGISAINILEGAVGQATGIVTRLRELATQAANGSFSNTQRVSLDSEAYELSKEYNRIIASTTFNGRSLLLGGSGTLSIQLGYGSSGQLGSQTSAALERTAGTGKYGTGTSAAALSSGNNDNVVVDLDGDGDKDVVRYGGLGAQVVLQNPDGTFSTGQSYAFGGDFTGFEVADLDNDGRVDLIGISDDLGGGSPGLFVRYGNGNGTFGNSTTIAVSDPYLNGLAIGDFNGDGNEDLAYSISYSSGTFVRLGNGNRTFKSEVFAGSFNLSYGTGDVGDINADGKDDLAASSSVYLSNGDGRFIQGQAGILNSFNKLVDLNHDGKADLITLGAGSANVYLSNGNGSFRAPSTLNITGISTAYGVHVGDTDSDGDTDFLVSFSEGVSGPYFVRSFYNDGGGGFSQGEASSIDDVGVTLADFNDDGILDVQSGTNIYFATTQQVSSIARLDLRSITSAREAIGQLETIANRLANAVGEFGSFTSRLESANRTLSATVENTRNAEGRIVDADVAQEAANMVRLQILQQTSAAILSQSNRSPEIALDLLRAARF